MLSDHMVSIVNSPTCSNPRCPVAAMTKTVTGRGGSTSTNGVSSSHASCPPTPPTENNPGQKQFRRVRRNRTHMEKSRLGLNLRRYLRERGLSKMLAVMGEECSSGGAGGGEQCRDVTQDFLTTGRVGRRNALPDILGEHARLSTAELPDQMSCLSVTDDTSKNASTSNASQQSSGSHTASGSTQPKS